MDDWNFGLASFHLNIWADGGQKHFNLISASKQMEWCGLWIALTCATWMTVSMSFMAFSSKRWFLSYNLLNPKLLHPRPQLVLNLLHPRDQRIFLHLYVVICKCWTHCMTYSRIFHGSSEWQLRLCHLLHGTLFTHRTVRSLWCWVSKQSSFYVQKQSV